MRTHVFGSRHEGEAGVVVWPEHRGAGLLPLALFALAASLLMLLGLAATPARAAELSATQMKVSVWPEYDDPRVLVINQADLDPSVQLPTDVTFNIPKGAEIGMACEVDAGGGHACKPYQLVDKGDYQALTYKVEAQKKIFFEYYYDAFPAGTPERTFDFTYRPGFAVGTTSIEVQEPLRSSGFVVDPALSQTTTDSEGLTYHIQDYPDLPVDEPFAVSVSYTKTDSNPSVKPKDSAAPSGGLPAAGSGSNNTALFVVLAVLGFGTLVVGGYKVMRPAPASSGGRRGGNARGPARSQSQRPRGTRPNVSKAQASSTGRSSGGKSGKSSRVDDSDTKFCTSCGEGIRRADAFCPECGEEQG